MPLYKRLIRPFASENDWGLEIDNDLNVNVIYFFILAFNNCVVNMKLKGLYTHIYLPIQLSIN